ncbi:MAG: hypothetical protein JOY77_07970 [Alphaproteobacteria bacterium]|nr:hypothetical protein [Alphaproteobacteria bacterium]MBV9062853.1 hypothetical protein [Alphaproteobacteria bacterium]
MDAFSYLSVLLSIVLGLAVTQLLSGFAALVHARRRIALYWPVPVQMAATLLITVQVWWAMFGMRNVSHWTFAGFLIVLGQSIAIYLMAAFITPELGGEGRIDLREAYFRESRWFFGSILAALAISLLKNRIVSGGFQSGADLAGHAAFATVALAGFVSRSDVVHKTIAPLSLLLYALYIALLFVTLPS